MAVSSGCITLMANSIEAKAVLKAKKRGKTNQQKDCIDFFFYNGEKGCLGKGSPISFEDYKKMVFTRAKTLNLRERAIAKIGLDETQISEINPIPLSGFVFDSDAQKAYQDGEYVSSQFSVTWIFFSYSQLYVYDFIYDMTSDDTWETTTEFFYRDITSVLTETCVEERIDTIVSGCRKKKSTVKNNFQREYFKIIVPGDKFSYSMKSTPNIERSLMGAKQFIREKKM